MKQVFNPIFTLLFLCFFISTSFADNPSVTLNWNKRTPVLKGGTKNKPATIPSFENAVLDIRNSLPYYKIDIPGVEVSSFELVNPVYAQLTQEEAKYLPKQLLKASPEIVITSGLANEKPLSLISFVPIRMNNGQLEKLISFEYTYKTQQNLKKQGKNNRTYTNNSVLSTGQWYKIGVTSTGMYKLDRTTLQNMGLNVQNLDPHLIQIYGNGGGMLPQANAAHRADDLVQNAIMVVGEQNGAFDAQDYVLFYAKGPHTWQANAAKTTFEHKLNLYSDTAYYFLKVGPSPGLRVNTTSISGTPTATISTFTEHLFHETDKINLVISGREWYGEEFNAFKTSENFKFDVSDLVPMSEVSLTSSVLGISPAQSFTIGGRFMVSLNNVYLGTQNTEGHGGVDYHAAGDPSIQTFKPSLATLSYNNSNLTVNLSFDQGGIAAASGYLNYLELVAKRRLQLYGNQTTFRSLENISQNAISQFQIANLQQSDTYVWDVTNPLRPMGHSLTFNGNSATFSVKTDTLREFIVFNGSNFNTPQFFGPVNNQNLHALNSKGTLDMVIVTHPAFYSQATRLANHRQQKDNLKVAVVTTEQIYNEFSSGAQDVTAIRDLMKMVYDRKIQNHTKTADSLIYLLLFGDASYDYKSKHKIASLNRTAKNTNFVPVYEARESLNPLSTYSSEDYYGLLDDLEGEWSESSALGELLDIGIGRLPAQNEADATIFVDKLIAYDNPDHYGKWRNRISFVADDEDSNEHLRTADNISRIVENKYPDYNISKIYLDMYSQIPVANGKRSPDCAAALDEAVEQGSLLINYNGHGGETGWTGEQVLTVNQVNSWSNPTKPTFMLTATCEFGRYDDPRRSSASELAILNPNGGAIGMLTTTRPVFASYNEILNTDFFNTVFEPINGRMPRLGDIYKISKNKNAFATQVNNRNFTLLCDPSMRLAYPEEKVALTNVQVMDGAVVSDTIKALSKVTITGKVTDKQNQTLSNFEGKVNITVFEKPSVINTLGDGGGSNLPQAIKVLKNVVYEGIATVKNGIFTSTFIVPKDIAYNYGKSKISLYASGANTDAHGSKTDIIIGGAAKNIALDTIPPVIKLFMDNEAFVFGGLTGQDALLISHLSDSSGINTVGLGIGHEITATLDGKTENVKVLNEQYVANVDDFSSGTVRYLFKNLTKGPHELRLKAWDNHNNSSEKRIEFIVASTESIALDHVLNYPNPFSTNTTFHFDHNRAGEDLDIQIQVFTVSGKLIKTLAATSFGSKPHIAEISWNGRDDFGDVLAKGVYVYKLTIRSIKDGSKVSKYEKMVILN